MQKYLLAGICCLSFLSPKAQTFAIDSLEKALQITAEDTAKVIIFNRLCREYNNHDIDKALEYGNRGLSLARKLNYKEGIAKSYIFIGVAHYTNGNYNQAIFNYRQSLLIKEALNDKKGIAANLNNIGLIYHEQGENDKAIEYMEKSLVYAKQVRSVEIIKAAYKNLAAVYTIENNYRLAYEYDQLYSSIQDSLFDVEKNKRITELEALYENEKKQREIDSLKIEKNRKQTLIYAFCLGLIFVLVLTYVIFKAYRQKQRDNKLLKIQNEEITRQKEELAKLSLVAEKTDSGVIIADADGNLEWANLGVIKMTGGNFEEFKVDFGTTLSQISSNLEIEQVLADRKSVV